MVDIADKKVAFAGMAVKGNFLRKRELFKGVRELAAAFEDIEDIEKDVLKAEKKGDAPQIMKDFKREFSDLDEFQKHLEESMVILLLYAHKLKTDLKEMDTKAQELAKEGFSEADIVKYRRDLQEELGKLNTLLAKIAGIAASVQRE